MNPWVAAARPKTLVAGLVPVVLGSAYAFNQGAFRLGIFLGALLGALAIQIGTNYVNDASDFQKGADTKDRLGPPRMAASGLLSPRALYVGAGIFFFLALIFGAYLVKEAGPWMLAIGLVSIFFAVVYTAGPFPLAYLGLGDLFVLIFFGLVAVLGTIFAHFEASGQANAFAEASAIYLALATGFHGMGLIAVNNLRDIPTDILAGKKTLAVRLGDKASRFYFSLLEFLPYFCWMPISSRIPGAFAFLPYFSLPLATLNSFVCFRIRDRREFNGLLARSAALQLLFGLLASLSLVLSR
jgi:1,4-dihydroxy-2-naphthoate polyprenyltransferase